MIRMTFEQAAQCLGVPMTGTGSFEGIVTDSRQVAPGMLFAALPGERVDGHDFVDAAAEAGACCLLVDRPVESALPQLVVENVLLALGQLARAWRESLNLRVVGITGSNGKTTTKEMVASILGLNSEVLATQGNFNNELGLPLSLFNLNESHRFAVLEMGAGKAGDIRYLAGIAKPEVGVVTNAGQAHLQGFGSEEGVARAKGEIFSSLPADGFAVINSDDRWSPIWLELAGDREILGFGLNPESTIGLDRTGGTNKIITPAGSFVLRLQLPGEHNIFNALAATAVAVALEIPLEQIEAGLAATQPVPGRLNLVNAEGGWTIIDDTYNANPASLYAALQMLTSQFDEPWLVLGDMKELGSNSRKLHAEMGEAAAALGIRRLFAVGELSEATVEAFGAGAEHFRDTDSLIKALIRELSPGVACLVKGSRSMAMEQVVQSVSVAGSLREAG